MDMDPDPLWHIRRKLDLVTNQLYWIIALLVVLVVVGIASCEILSGTIR